MGGAHLGSRKRSGRSSTPCSRVEQLGSKIGFSVATKAGFTNQDRYQFRPHHGLSQSSTNALAPRAGREREPEGIETQPSLARSTKGGKQGRSGWSQSRGGKEGGGSDSKKLGRVGSNLFAVVLEPVHDGLVGRLGEAALDPGLLIVGEALAEALRAVVKGIPKRLMGGLQDVTACHKDL